MNLANKKRLRQILAGIITVIGLILILNMFLTDRLERLLRKELIVRTSKATDGFYQLSFNQLSISFLSGELSLKGIRIQPDSAVFNEWASRDSLPEQYIRMEVGLIDFKGVNLVWRLRDKQLHFRTFEIESPKVEVFQSERSCKIKEDAIKNAQSKTLYELIAPYLNVVTVETMNLENAKVFYTIPDQKTPMIYALNDVTFHGYGFRLDSLSSKSGKLLYCDNFDFVTNQSQTLLTNKDFVLSSDTILLDTKKAVIHIGNINLQSQKALWRQTKLHPRSSLEGHIESVDVRGIAFHRENSLSYLTAKTFDIRSSDISAVSMGNGDTSREQTNSNGNIQLFNADSLIHAMSLYEIISPILHRVAIERIGIDKARFNYSLAVKDSMEIYTLDDFRFEARGVVVDDSVSLTGSSKYYEYITFDATGIKGVMTARNQLIAIERMAMDTEEERLRLENITVTPLRTANKINYFSGKIDTISLNGVSYNQGVKARSFSISGTNMFFFKSPDTCIHLNMPRIVMNDMKYDSKQVGQSFKVALFTVELPDIRLTAAGGSKGELHAMFNRLDFKDLVWSNSGYDIGRGDIRMNYFYLLKDSFRYEHKQDTVSLSVTGLHVGRDFKNYRLDDFEFDIKDLVFPVDNGFYTLSVGDVSLDKHNLKVNNLHLESNYPKMDFSYRHPKHTDWFDIKVRSFELKEIDIGSYFKTHILDVKEAIVTDMSLQNLKNQKVVLPRRIVPMVYEGVQKTPVKFNIPTVNVTNFSVVYEELPRDGDQAGRLYITDVNGTISGLTNVVTSPDQFFRIDAEARFMGKGHFTATWMMPVSASHDQFLVHARLDRFDLTALNELITPLAKAEIVSGSTHDLIFDMDASGKRGTIRMEFPYNDLKVELLKEKDGELTKNSFISFFANAVVKNNNPDHPGRENSELRIVETTIERDPYHSIFNYLWQMLRPALTETVGVSKTAQSAGTGVMKFIQGVKNIFKEEYGPEQADQ